MLGKIHFIQKNYDMALLNFNKYLEGTGNDAEAEGLIANSYLEKEDYINALMLDGESNVIGALADSVEEVIDLEPEHIQPPPKIGTKIQTDFIKGMGKRDAQLIMILDMDRVFSAEDLTAARGAEASKAAMEAAA